MQRHSPPTFSKHQEPLITVGLASYNRPDLLIRAIKSIQDQQYKNIEILISDNGSCNSEVNKIIENFAEQDSRVKYFLHPVNQGTFVNFRFLLEHAKGEYFIWLADDDYWSEKFLANISFFSRQSNAALTYGKLLAVDVDLPEIDRRGKELDTCLRSSFSLLKFIIFDTDSIIYGLFKTKEGKKLAPLLKNWSFSENTLKYFPFLAYNFPSYPFIFGLLISGGFYNASSDETVHYVGGRPPYSQQPKLNFRHLVLVRAYISMHIQMIWRFILASLIMRSITALIWAPVAGIYLLIRRTLVALLNRKRRNEISAN